MKHRLLILTLISLVFINSVTPSTAISLDIYGDSPEENKPILQVLKWTNNNEIQKGNSITVNVNITNWSDEPAYNLTIEEPIFSNWSVTNFQDYDEYVYTKFDVGASISYQYTMTLLNEGNYTIEPTMIKYLDVNGTQFQASSGYIPVNVFIIPPPLEVDDLWRNILLMGIGFITLPLITYAILRYRR